MEYQLRDVLIELTKRCNLNCIHCGSSCDGEAPERELDIGEWVLVIDALARINVKKIIFSGGEPTLLTGLPRLIRAAYNRGLKYGLITNGFIMSDDLEAHIAGFPPFGVGVSLDGLHEIHNRIRDNEHSWRCAIKTILRLQEIKARVCVVTTLSKMNVEELPNLANYLWATGIDCWQLQLAMPAGRMKKQKDMLLDEADFKKICSNILAFKRRYTSMQIEAADCFGMAEAGIIRTEAWNGCGAGLSAMAIDATGRIMPCLSLQGHYCGHITDGIDVVWENSTGFDFNRNFIPLEIPSGDENPNWYLTGKCGRCELLAKCRGGCASQAYFTFGHFHDSPFCYRRSFEQAHAPRPESEGRLDVLPQAVFKYGLPDDISPSSQESEMIIKYGLPEDLWPTHHPSQRRTPVLFKYGLPERRR